MRFTVKLIASLLLATVLFTGAFIVANARKRWKEDQVKPKEGSAYRLILVFLQNIFPKSFGDNPIIIEGQCR